MWPAGLSRCCRGSWSSAPPARLCAGTCAPAPVPVKDSGSRSCSTPATPSPPGLERQRAEESAGGRPGTRWKKLWRWGEGGRWQKQNSKNPKRQTNKKKMNNGCSLSCGSNRALSQGPGDCFYRRIAAESFQRFAGGTFFTDNNIHLGLKDRQCERGLVQHPTCPNDLHSLYPRWQTPKLMGI